MLARERARLSPKLRATDLIERSERRREVAREDALARERASIEAVRNNALAIIDEQGGSAAQKFGANLFAAGAEFIGVGPQGVARAGSVGAALLTNVLDPDQMRATLNVIAASELQVEAARELREAAKDLSSISRQIGNAMGGGPALKAPGVDK